MKAEECYKQAIAIDQQNVLANSMYGMACYLNSREKDAELFFESSVSLQAQSIPSWVLLGLYYEAMGNINSMEMSYRRAEAVLNLDQPKIVIAPMKNTNSKMSLTSKDLRQSISSRDGFVGGKSAGGPPTDVSERIEEERSQDLNEESTMDAERTKQDSLLGTTAEKMSNSPTSLHSGIDFEVHGDIPVERTTSVNQHEQQQQSIFLVTAEFLLEMNAVTFCEMSLAHHLDRFAEKLGTNYYTLTARLYLLKGDYENAEHNAEKAIRFDVENAIAWESLSHAQYLMGKDIKACQNYERTLALVGEPYNVHIIYFRLASLYLKQEKFDKAKKIYLCGCKNSATALQWLGLGVSCYRLGEISEAEDALAEANILNNLEADIWAYLCLVCLKTNRYPEAEQTLKFALKCGLKDDTLLAEIEMLKSSAE